MRLGWADRPPVDAHRLHPGERLWLDRAPAQHPRRRADWIAARLGLALLLPSAAHVLSGADGAPQVIGAGWAVSVSHDDGWVAVAARKGPGRIGIDVVPDSAAPAAARAIARVRPRSGDAGEPASAWAALECAAKLRGVGIAVLLDCQVGLERRGEQIRVEGLGPPAHIRLRRLPGAVLAVADEP